MASDQKLTMSLDDIIKMNKNRKGGQGANRGGQGGQRRFGGANRGGRPNQGGQQRGNKEHGLLQRNNAIRRRRGGQNNQGNRMNASMGGGQGRKRFNGNNASAVVFQKGGQKNFNRRPNRFNNNIQQRQNKRNFSVGRVQQQQQQRPQLAPMSNQQRQQKRIQNMNMRAALGIRQRRGQGAGGPPRNKIAMQVARKGVQKAKRVLINKRRAPIQQMMPRRLQGQGRRIGGGILQKRVNILRRQAIRKQVKQARPQIIVVQQPRNNVRQQVQNRQKMQRQQQMRANRPIIKRNRLAGVNRMIVN